MTLCITLPGSPALVTSAFTIERPQYPLAIEVASYGTAAGVTLAFSQTSGTAPWQTLMRSDGSGLPFIVFSGTGGGTAVVPHVPSPFARIVVTSGQTSAVSFLVNAVLR